MGCARGRSLLRAVQRLSDCRSHRSGRRIRQEPGFLDHWRIRLSRHAGNRTAGPLCLRRLRRHDRLADTGRRRHIHGDADVHGCSASGSAGTAANLLFRPGQRRRAVPARLWPRSHPATDFRGNRRRRQRAAAAVSHGMHQHDSGRCAATPESDPIRAKRGVLVGWRSQGALDRPPERPEYRGAGYRRLGPAERNGAGQAFPARQSAHRDPIVHATPGRYLGRLHL